MGNSTSCRRAKYRDVRICVGEFVGSQRRPTDQSRKARNIQVDIVRHECDGDCAGGLICPLVFVQLLDIIKHGFIEWEIDNVTTAVMQKPALTPNISNKQPWMFALNESKGCNATKNEFEASGMLC